MKVLKTKLPKNSLLNGEEKKYDYVDSYRGAFLNGGNTPNSEDLCRAFFLSSPSWVGKLFMLRNSIAGLLGLKISGDITNRQASLDGFTCQPGERIGLFKIFSRTANEVVMGEDDKHLDFRVSLFLHPLEENEIENILTISTTVLFHNWFGSLYFVPVRPFHKMIVPAMLKGIVRQLALQKR